MLAPKAFPETRPDPVEREVVDGISAMDTGPNSRTVRAHWGHRRSTDINVAVPVGTGLGRHDPGRDPVLVNRMAAVGTTEVHVRFRTFTFTFPNGRRWNTTSTIG